MDGKKIIPRGFTVVELLVVIVVIGILASITIVGYSFVKDDGMDAKIRSTVRTVGDAIQLYESKGNTTTIAEGTFEKTNGVDALLVPQFLKTGYRDGLKSTVTANRIFWYSKCRNSATGEFVIFAALNNASDDDIAQRDKIKNYCGVSSGGEYTYAQLF